MTKLGEKKSSRSKRGSRKHPQTTTLTASNYGELLSTIKARINKSRFRAYRAINKELIDLYWFIGKEIAERQELEGWGKSVVQRLAQDLRKEFPGTDGFSPSNLWFMRQLYLEYRHAPNLLRLVREIPWGQNITIMTRLKDPEERQYYLQATAQMAWTRNVLINQIKAGAFKRHAISKKQHNFEHTLPIHLAEQADKAMKDVYMLDFLGIAKPVLEREMERRMVNQIRDVLLEMGYGFAFLGNQYRVSSGRKDYYIDLLLYHRFLHCLVAVELKACAFEPEYAGKMNFYLNLLDDHVRQENENPSIGIILCAERDRVDVEYALRGIAKPMGVAEYKLTKELPPEIAHQLPDVNRIEREVLKELQLQVPEKNNSRKLLLKKKKR